MQESFHNLTKLAEERFFLKKKFLSSMRRKRNSEALVIPKLRDKMSKKLNETQSIAAHLLGAGHKPKDIAKKLGVREEQYRVGKVMMRFMTLCAQLISRYMPMYHRQKSL